MTAPPTPVPPARVYAGHRSAMGGHKWQQLGWDLDRATELATYGAVAGELPVSYQALKFAVIGRLPRSRAWSITSAEIEEWAGGEQNPAVDG